MTSCPPRPVRVADTWPITRQAAQVLLGERARDGDFELEGSLVEVEKAAEGTALTAIIEISGELDLEQGRRGRPGEDLVRLRAAPAAAAADDAAGDRRGGPRRERDTGIVEARGYIAKVQMGRQLTTPLDEDGRLQRDQHPRARAATSAGRAASRSRRKPPRPSPRQPPTADETNSWLLYDDPQGRFHFRHPQELEIKLERTR